MTTTIRTSGTASPTCDPAASITKSLLGYGVLAGPAYVGTWLAQALTRDGFDLTRHPASALANGDLGWIQTTNFTVTGLMTLAMAAGMRRALRRGIGRRWAPRLVGVYGASLLAAAAFRADPVPGFPPGTPAQAEVSWHGVAHLAAGGVGFLSLVAACLLLARRFAADGERGWAAWSGATGVTFLAAFVGIASGSGSPASIVAFSVAVVVAWTWLSTLASRLYRDVTRTSQQRG